MIAECDADIPKDGMNWSKFHWVENKDKVSGKPMKRAAMFVPLTLQGCNVRLYAQLDTGAPASYFSGPAIKHLPETCRSSLDLTPIKSDHGNPSQYSSEAWTFHIIAVNYAPGDAELERHEIIYTEDYGKGEDDFSFGEGEEKGINIGTVGMDYFQGRQLVIDYPGERFAILEKDAPLPQELREKMEYIPMSILHNVAYLPIEADGYRADAVFDTGSSSAVLDTPKKFWQQLTGRTGDEVTNTVEHGMAWGAPIRMVSAPLRKKLSIGGRMTWDETSNVEVRFIDHEKATESREPIIGNAPFWDDSVIVLDLVNKRFGHAIVR